MANGKIVRRIALRAAGLGAALALAGLALVASPAAATSKTTTTVVTATSPAYTGAPIVFTATVTHGKLTPTGTVTFTITGSDSSTPTCDGGSNTVTLSPASTGSSAQCSISAGLFADASPYTVQANYSGDGTFAISSGTLSQKIKKGPTTTTVTSSSEPSVTGEPLTFTAVVAPTSPSTGVPTGTVTFSITGTGGTSLPCDSGDGQTLDSSDTAQCSVAAGLLAANSPYSVTAAYSGDDDYAVSTGSVTQKVARATATIGVTSSSTTAVATGQPVTFTASVTGITPPGAGTPTGSIVFSVVGSDGTNALCQGGDTVALSGLSAACNFPAGLPGTPLTYTVSATLQDPNFKSPVAGTLVQTVNRAATAVYVTGLPGSLVASQAFTFNVVFKTVAPGTGAPTGDFEWAVCPTGQTSCTPQTGTKGGTFNLPKPTKKDIEKNENRVTITVPEGLVPGFYDVQASFLGDSDLVQSSSTEGHILVRQIPTKMDLVINHNPIRNGGRLKVRAAIIADPRATDSLGAPTGTVTFTITDDSGDQLTCTAGTDNVITISTNLQNQGLAKCAIPRGQVMTSDSPYKVKAVYSGDSNYAAVKGTAKVTVETISG